METSGSPRKRDTVAPLVSTLSRTVFGILGGTFGGIISKLSASSYQEYQSDKYVYKYLITWYQKCT